MLKLCLGFGLARGDRLHDGPKKEEEKEHAQKKWNRFVLAFFLLGLTGRVFLDKTGWLKFGNVRLCHTHNNTYWHNRGIVIVGPVAPSVAGITLTQTAIWYFIKNFCGRMWWRRFSQPATHSKFPLKSLDAGQDQIFNVCRWILMCFWWVSFFFKIKNAL